MRIAIVDDVESERKELHQKVSAGLECHAISAEIFEYNSGKPFLTAAKQNKFALVFMDIYMGSENGIEKDRTGTDTDQVSVCRRSGSAGGSQLFWYVGTGNSILRCVWRLLDDGGDIDPRQ